MTIASLSQIADPNGSVPQHKRTSLSQYDFLNLLITQMKYQNPLNPMDYYQMTSMLTQFGSLEALYNLNQNLENSILYQSSLYNLQAAELIGKKIKSIGNTLSIEKGVVSEGYYQLAKPGKVSIQIIDSKGNVVRTFEEEYKSATEHRLQWDGKDNTRNPLSDGVYYFNVSAVDKNGQPIPVTLYKEDKIEGIRFENGIIYLITKSDQITIKDIISIME